jgi:hypothetical protein
MSLSFDAILIYVLHSGCRGHLTTGRIERNGEGGLDVYGSWQGRNEYLSGNQFRSWCVLTLDNRIVADWHSILPRDRGLLRSGTASPSSL